jgi:hypothetical protein
MPFPLVALLISAAFTIAGQLLMPRPKTKPASLNEIDVPTATEDRPKPVFVGTVRHKSPNCIWYGDFSTKAIKKPGSLYFNKVTVGYKYLLGIQLNLGWGQVDAFRRILLNDKEAWAGTATTGSVTINKPELFGGEDSGGSGGFQATAVFYNGNGSQGQDAYVLAKTGAVPAYKDDALIVFKGLTSGGAYIGNSPTFPEIAVDLSRYPNQLGVGSSKHIIDTYDANPVCALYEFMTRSENEFGGGFAESQFNLTNWRTAAEQIHSEGLGISRMFDTSGDVEEIMSDYLNLIDGVINVNMQTGKFELVLARDDYDPETILELTDDDFTEITSFTRGSWADTFNEVKLSYVDRTQQFESIPVAAQDLANASGQAEVRQQTVAIEGLSNPTTANKIIWRELRPVSIPLGKLEAKINRRGYTLYGGAVFKWTSEKYEVSMIMRVSEVDDGRLQDNTMIIKCVQDVFSLGSTAYGSPSDSGWDNQDIDPVPITVQEIFQQPIGFHGTADKRVYTVAKRPGESQQGYNLWTKEASESDYSQKVVGADFTPTGLVESSFISGTDLTLTITPDSDMDELPAVVTQTEIDNGGGLIKINDEIMAYEAYTVNIDGDYEFTGLHPGLYGTTPDTHAPTDRVWFISEGAAFDPSGYPLGETVNAKLLTITPSGVLDIGDATPIDVTLDSNAYTGIISDIPVDGTPSDGDVPIYDSASGTFIYGPAGGTFDIHALTAKTTPVDADEFALADSAASWVAKKISWANLKTILSTLYEAVISGRAITAATVVANDKVLIQDTSNSDNLKTVNAIDIANLGVGGGGGFTQIVKTATQTKTSDTALANDNTLSFSMAASTTYIINLVVLFTSSATPDIKYALTGPASPVVVASWKTLIGSATAHNSTYESSYTPSSTILTTGNTCFIIYRMVVINGANSGTFAFQWAQNTSSVDPTSVYPGSYLEYRAAV